MKPLLISLVLVLRISAQAPSEPSLNKVDLLIRQGQLAEAETATREFVDAHPASADGHFLLGNVLFLRSKATESLAEYTEGAKYRAPSARDLKVVASDYVVLGDYVDADKWFTKAVEWAPQDVQGWYSLGRTKYNENRFDEAISTFKHALELDPAHVKAMDNLGLSYEGKGLNDEAVTAYRQAIAMEEKSGEKNAGPYLDLATLMITTEKPRDALPLLERAVAISPGDYRIWRESGKAYLRLNELEEARGKLEKAIELAPRDAPLHFVLAQVYRKQGLAAKAKQETDRYTALK